MPTQEKIAKVAEIAELFKNANAFFVTEYQGLNVADETVLRKGLRENQVRYLVSKNTLFRLGAKEAGVVDINEYLTGPTAVAFCSDDPAVAAKILNDSFKDKELPITRVFVVDGVLYQGTEIKRLADLPPKEVLYAQLVAAVESPFSALVGSIDGFFRKLVGVVDALAEKKKSEE